MIFGRKGQQQSSVKWIIGITVVLVAASIALAVMQTIAEAPPFPTSPQEYATAWKDYGEAAFTTKEGDQPWRLLSIFFFPLLAYFSLLFFAINLVFANSNIAHWYDAQKPLVVFAFAIAFLILPMPTTYGLFQIVGGITFILPIFVWMVMITMIVLVIYHSYRHQQGAIGGGGGGGGGGQHGQPAAPGVATPQQPLAPVAGQLNQTIHIINYNIDILDNL